MPEWTEVWDDDLRSADPLTTPGYSDRLDRLDGESVRTGRTATHVRIEGRFDVLGGSMGVVHGERVVRAFDRATDLGLPVVCETRSGGARMQEGMVALLQMGRVSAAVARHGRAGNLSAAVLRGPTTGGVFASYGSACDIRVAESGALVGFSGPKVVEATAGVSVDGLSHRAETAHAAGLVDAVVDSDDLDTWVDSALGVTRVAPPLPTRTTAVPVAGSSPWDLVRTARHPDRPTGVDVAAALCDSWLDLAAPDPTVRTALATIDDTPVVIVASDRHADDGRPRPAGFRQARRAVELAGRTGRPIVSLVDTPGAAAEPASENDGIAAEIAATFQAFAEVPVPTVGVCVGEGGSGGALALAWTDRLLIQRTAVFSVIAPEAAAVILGRAADEVPAVADELALTSDRLAALGVVDEAVDDAPSATATAVRSALASVEAGERRSRPDAVSAAALTRA